MTMLPLPMNHVGLTVPDVVAAVDWYREVFGFSHVMGPRLLEASRAATAETGHVLGPRFRRAYQAHLLAANGVGLELFQFVEPEVAEREPEPAWWRRGPWHLCFTHPEVGVMAARIAAAGGEQRTPVFDFVPGRPWQLVYCADPWGTTLELMSASYAEVFANWPQPGSSAGV